jgi:LacI family transcriptional regulator
MSEIYKSNPESASSRPTARDVAKLAKVSQSTVSRVLNEKGGPFISDDTRKRVRDVAMHLGYSPNPFARALRGRNTHLLGLIVRETADPFCASLISELSTQADALGYKVILSSAHSDPTEALLMASAVYMRYADGVMILGDLHEDETAIREIRAKQRALVTMCRGSALQGVLTVNTDNRKGTDLLLGHLASLGHRRFAYIDSGRPGDMKDRRDRFVEYLNEHGLDLPQEAIQRAESNSEGGYNAMQRVMAIRPRPTAILASNDLMAIGAMKAALEMGMRIPHDISVAGWDDIEFCRFVHPSLTSIRQPIEQISSEVLGLLRRVINGENVTENSIHAVDPVLTVRQSTGPAPQHESINH